ncbi:MULTISPECIES: hypothetical protein [Pectobacterium]|uniref:hypothetical protein n=1 Tax=Pectobacterium TaxID=122277 RepID=UPI000D498162|nr:hypothetical protein [Pectobacterium parmentieri]MBN3177402.1 hypothetical protein [Pectobacterium parmentieri]POW25926.1 hypothetical protein PB20LOC_03115 [Pectobacterium parmentieri]QPK19489.1 hypothetical protein PB20LOC_019160 [Pectobacterium parmentieri]QRN29896.1 hypothetical protein IG623_22060 [Pectobacterium parmentieri]
MTVHHTAQPALTTTGYICRFRMPELLGISMPTIEHGVKYGTDMVEINSWLTTRLGEVT